MTLGTTSTVQAGTVEEVQAAVRAHARLRPVAGRTKPALSGLPAADEARHDTAPVAASAHAAPDPASSALLDLSTLAGVIEYQPAECTFTARPGTRIADVERMLAEDGLCLPFDPPFGARGATLGGTVAAGLSGPGRFRYGGVRDFLLGVQFVDGEGRLVRGGARVVKNAAGFSLQHALLGSLGRLGVLVELTFKVFPQAPARLSLAADFGTLDRALDALVRLRCSSFELEALELVPPGTLLLRMGGVWAALHARVDALTAWLSPARVTQLTTEESDRAWAEARELAWVPDGHALVKVATTPGTIARLDAQVAGAPAGTPDGMPVPRRYSVGGEVAWLGWPGPLDTLDRLLRDAGLSGLALTGAVVADPLLGVRPDDVFLGRLRQTLDPRGVFSGASRGE